MPFRAGFLEGTFLIEAIVLIALVVLFLKEPGCGFAVLGALVLVGVCIWYFAIQIPADKRLEQERLDDQARAAVVVWVRYDRDSCPDREYPLWTRVRNGPDRTLESVDWKVTITEPGHSSDLLDGEGRYKSDRILKPGWVCTDCFGLPSQVRKRRDAGRLVYSAEAGVVGWR